MKPQLLVGVVLDRLPVSFSGITFISQDQGISASKIKYYVNQK